MQSNVYIQIESLDSEHSYLEKQLSTLEAASKPKKDEIDRLKELKKIISVEEKEIERLEKGSKQLKDKVCSSIIFSLLFFYLRN